MHNKPITKTLCLERFARVVLLLLLLSASDRPARALDSSYTEIPVNSRANSAPLIFKISSSQSKAYNWAAGKSVLIQALVNRPNGKSEAVVDVEGKDSWKITLNKDLEGEIRVTPAKNTFSGRLEVRADGKILYATTPYLNEAAGKILEKIYEYKFPDGAKIKVHYTDQILEESGAQPYFAKDVLDAAVFAYQTITQFEGFNSEGYTFAHPDTSYAYDPDRTIDVYIGNPGADNAYPMHGFSNTSFRDAPCFDISKLSETQFNAVILLPANYDQFIKNWEKLNPSPLGKRNLSVDLKGTLIHEMLHVIIFYYNKNLNKEAGADDAEIAVGGTAKKQVDWYVEGLARYFETLAGARHDFFSQGFKQLLPDKIRFSRGGSNYFMRYPDQPFTQLRYENALFWRFMDVNFGMSSIESLSRDLRTDGNFMASLEKASGLPFNEILKKFALAILLNDFGLKEDQKYLKEIARTHLLYEAGDLYLLSGNGAKERLGKTCRTDWVGSWEGLSAERGTNPVAGDNTDLSDVSGWATDYIQMDIDHNSSHLPTVSIAHEEGGKQLIVQAVLITQAGSRILKELKPIDAYGEGKLDLEKTAQGENLRAADISKVYFLITNTDPKKTSVYSLSV